MAVPVLIDLSNYELLLRSSSPSGSSPDGNVYFDTVAGTIQFIPASELAQITYPVGHPNYSDGLAEDNPLTTLLGIKFEAIYAFENQERKASYPGDASGPLEDLRAYDRWTEGTFKFGGAYNFIKGRTPAAAADRDIIRGSGWNEYDANGVVIRKYFGVKGLGSIEATSTPYYQQSQYGTTVPYPKGGNIDQAVLVYEDSNGDGTPEIDYTDTSTTNMYMSVRTYGKNYDRIDTAGTLGIAELAGYSTGAALNESDHLTTDPDVAHVLSTVWDGVIGGTTTATTPWTGMSLDKVTPQTETGFTTADGTFSWVLANTNGGSLVECVAYFDAIAQADDIVTTGTELNGKSYDVWYEYTATGNIRPITGAGDGLGVFIENLPAGDKNSVEYRDDNGDPKVYPNYTSVAVNIGQGAIDDPEAWFHCFEQTGYNTAGAVTYTSVDNGDVKGIADGTDPFVTGTTVSFQHNYQSLGDVDVIFLCEGDGLVTQQTQDITLSNTPVSTSCIPATETNV